MQTYCNVVERSKSSSNLAMLLESMPKGKNFASRFVGSLRTSPYLWDPWILKDDDVYRLFYLTCPKPAPSVPFWSQGTIAGAVSTDLIHWKSTGIVLEPEPANTWEAGRMLAGNTYKENGIYYLFYSAAGAGKLLGQERIGLATSTDGITWKRHSPNPLFLEEEYSLWYGEEKYEGDEIGHLHFRDPYIVKDCDTGRYYMFICAYLNKGFANKYRACIGLAVADQITGPYKLLPPAAAPTDSEIEEWPFLEMERPQVIYQNGKYHLFFSCWSHNLNPKWTSKLTGHQIKDTFLYWFTSDKIDGPYKPTGDIPVVRGSEKTGLYGTNFFPMPDNPEEFMTIGWYYRLYTLQIFPRFKAWFKDDAVEISRL